MNVINVFISYSHDSEAHRAKVLALSERLRADGINTLFDQYVNGSPAGGWPRWMLDQLDAATFVLVICTETYYRRFRGHEEPGKGKGVDWEGALITQELYDARSRTLKFVPVFLSEAVADWIPEPLRSIGHYALASESSYQSFYDFLLGQAGVEPSPVGALKRKPRQTGIPLTFDAPPAAQSVIADISRIIKYAPAELIGREAETALLNDAWTKVQNQAKPRPHILTFVGLGGEGKTSLVAKWVADLAANDWPGCEAAFAWSFYSQGTREQMAASADLFLKEALVFFGDEKDKEFAGSAAGVYEKGERLARAVGRRRCLLILDGLEPLQYSPASPTPGELKDQGLAALLKGLAANSLGLCVITTRVSLPDLRAFWQRTAPELPLTRLSRAAGVDLLQRLGVRRESGSQAEFERLVEDVKGHALTLTLLGGFLRRAFRGDIRQRDRVRFERADERIDGGHALRTMAAYEQWLLSDGGDEGQREVAVLRLMGLFDRPADAGCLAALRAQPAIPGLTEPLVGLADDDWEFALSGLEAAKLLTVNRDMTGALISLDAHPHLRAYFAKRLKEDGGMMKEGADSSFIHQSSSFREAHRRVYEHLCATTPDKPQPTLEDLQPLYQAVAHGCQAGLQGEARAETWFHRIRKGNDNYSVKKLGAFGSELGAVACFFETPWSRVSPALEESTQARHLNYAAYILRALGRLTEALDPMRTGLKMGVEVEDWKEAAIRASNLSELELTLGEVFGAVEDAEQSVIYADRSRGGISARISAQIRVADAYLAAGQINDANYVFSKVEADLAKANPANQWLPGNWGFRQDEARLAEVEQLAWNATLGTNRGQDFNRHLALAHSIFEHGSRRIDADIKAGQALLDVALDHLALGRAVLYAAILEQSAILNPQSAIDAAVAGLRRAGTLHHLPHALLTRAWLRALTGVGIGPASAQSDLDEAWEIAARGPMRLFLADIHLYRARLFGGMRDEGGVMKEPYPWESVEYDLAEAERLINECGYHRRDEELADAKRALLGIETS